MAFFMEKMSVLDMKNAMKETSTVIIPVGVVEQHGYHLPLNTDIYIASQLPREAEDRLNAVVAPSVNYCFSGGTLPGTINVSPNTFGLLISEICSEFVRTGFENIIVLLGHGGTDNKIALKNTLQMLLRRDSELAKKITLSLIEVDELSPTYQNIMVTGPEHDFHAGLVETSIMMYWNPEAVHMEKLKMDDEYIAKMMRTDQDWYEKREKPLDSPFVVEVVGQRDEIEVGVMGFPEKANRELGEKICGEMADGLVKYVNMLEEYSKQKK